MTSHGAGVLRWKLHQQLEKRDAVGPKVIVMEIRPAQGMALDSDLGCLKLHHMELWDSDGLMDPSLRIHEPSAWSLNINHHSGAAEDAAAPPKKILHYAISGNESYAATLAEINDGLALDVWKFTPHAHGLDKTSALLIPVQVDPESKARHAQHYATKRVLVPGIQGRSPEQSYKVSLSWDATQLVLTDASASYMPQDVHNEPSAFAIYCLSRNNQSSSAALSTLEPYVLPRCCEELANFKGYGKFHITTRSSKDVKDELFITCESDSVQVYGVHLRWTHIRTIKIDQPQDNPHFQVPNAWRLINGIQGRYFVWTPSYEYEVLVWNLEDGSMVAFALWQQEYRPMGHLDRTTVGLSSDDSLMAIHRGRHITTHLTASGTVVGSSPVPAAVKTISGIQFICGDTQILVQTSARDTDFGQGAVGYILDATSMALLSWFSVPGAFVAQRSSMTNPQHLYSAFASTLDLIPLHGRILHPFSQPPTTGSACVADCDSNLTSLSILPQQSTSPLGLHFSVILQPPPAGSPWHAYGLQSVVVNVSSQRQNESRRFVIPPLQDRFDEWEKRTNLRTNPWKYKYAVLVENCSRLVVASPFLLMVWALPATLDGPFDLLYVWCIRRDNSDFSYSRGGLWNVCPHHQLHARRDHLIKGTNDHRLHVTMRPTAEHPTRCEDGSDFLKGIIIWIDNLTEADETCRAAVLRYISAHIDSFPDVDRPKESVLAAICRAWKLEVKDSYEFAVSSSLKASTGSWVHSSALDAEFNPIWILLVKARNQPRAVGLAEIIIDHCVHKTKDRKDPHYLRPIIHCLPELLDSEQFHAELALTTMQSFAYIPIKSRRVVLDYQVIVHPPGAQIWGASARPLYRCKNPILQIGSSKCGDHKNDKYTGPLFVTSFDLLWQDKSKDSSRFEAAVLFAPASLTVPSWIRSLFVIIWHKFKLKDELHVKCRKFQPDMLENPAIIAMIEHKWNTIGFYYWLARFICQCCFYLLVLVAVFVQVYGPDREALTGVFIAIIIVASIFLWLEVAQLCKHRWEYISSVYNLVDLAAFALPLAGGINQLILASSSNTEGGHPGLLSFAVLVISLHLLFELRVNEAVCHFVAIITRIFVEIRIFFIIFAGGILAYAVAILHLLRACTAEPCPVAETEFPKNFYGAISSTYFFMGGRYDPVGKEFSSDTDWAFHTIMMSYLFFTVILMLNVLIALLNVAFTRSDETWRLVWLGNKLGYVESAENMTYLVPGLRHAYNWFPKEIYYTATAKDVEKYFDGSKQILTSEGKGRKLFGSTSFSTGMLLRSPSASIMDSTVPLSPAVQHEEELDKSEQQSLRQEQGCYGQDAMAKELEMKLEEHQLQLQRQLKQQQDLFEEQSEQLTDRLQQGFEEQLARQQENHEAQLAALLEQISGLLNALH
ncbi:hypothetical protein BGZ67_001370 [Mortierella alpina]|nr:hypothetical protein BGZ67_001370 [Mortierella alpina]